MEIEICCGSIQSAANAKAAGATRIELCQNLNEGGTTPSYATIKQCVEELGLQVFVLVRPRPGDFVYNELEIQNMLEDVRVCKELGVAGIVVGFLLPDGRIDTALTKRFVAAAAPVPVTFHRAFDRCHDWQKSLEEVIECGCRRILTSGCQPTAMEGKETLRALIQQAGDRITILAGSGVRPDNVAELIQFTGAQEVHGSCKVRTVGGYDETSAEEVAALLQNATTGIAHR
ncbi:MAG: copper homeostasis protein CutC [Bacteroidales bacterium]|nr:copper homeostasis protein CutC [Bacteroidales bacterium]